MTDLTIQKIHNDLECVSTTRMSKITAIYQEFRQLFNGSTCPELFEAIASFSKMPTNEHFPHPLGHFAILYTPIPAMTRPEIMLLANNPSWFVDVAVNRHPSEKQKKEAHRIVVEMERGVPSKSSYIEHQHRFAKRIRKIFSDAGLASMLPNVIGMNWFWVQTGSDPYELNVQLDDPKSDLRKRDQLNLLVDYCRKKTSDIVNEIEPRNLFVLGRDAQHELPRMAINEERINIIRAKHPDRTHDLQHKLEKIYVR